MAHFTRTLKLKLFVVAETKQDKDRIWKRLYQLSDDTYKAANKAVSSVVFNEEWVQKALIRKKLNPNDNQLIAQEKQNLWDYFGVKDEAMIERDLKFDFPNLPPQVTNTLKSQVYAKIKSDSKELKQGKRSLPSFKAGFPIPVRQDAIDLKFKDDEFFFDWSVQRGEHISFGILFGRDPANYKGTITKILENKVQVCASSIQLKDKNLFLNLVVKELADTSITLDPNIIVGVDLGINVPAMCALNKGSKYPYPIGRKEDVIKVSLQLENRNYGLQKMIAMAKSGHGRKRKCKALKYIRNKIANFHTSTNQYISNRIIQFALEHKAGVIKIEDLKGIKCNSTLLRNWTYFQLQSMITNKAKKFNINVVKINPKFTSQKCSVCGNVDAENRPTQAIFRCKSCGLELNADFNAAINIANAT